MTEPAAVTTRTLVGVLVYGGEEFVPDCLDSVAALAAQDGVDVLVLDDHSPDEAWSASVAKQCARLGLARAGAA